MNNLGGLSNYGNNTVFTVSDIIIVIIIIINHTIQTYKIYLHNVTRMALSRARVSAEVQ